MASQLLSFSLDRAHNIAPPIHDYDYAAIIIATTSAAVYPGAGTLWSKLRLKGEKEKKKKRETGLPIVIAQEEFTDPAKQFSFAIILSFYRGYAVWQTIKETILRL